MIPVFTAEGAGAFQAPELSGKIEGLQARAFSPPPIIASNLKTYSFSAAVLDKCVCDFTSIQNQYWRHRRLSFPILDLERKQRGMSALPCGRPSRSRLVN
jgi:hypothetical protein